MRRLFVFAMLVLCGTSAFGQDNTPCGVVLGHAEDEFTAGRFYGIPSLLSECLGGNELTNEQKVRAYHLLVQTYLLIDDPIGAENSYLNLLRADPEYIATVDKDPIDVFYISKKFTSTPIFTPFGRIGGNTSFVRPIHHVNTQSTPVETKNILKPGWQVGGGIDFNFNDNISLTGEANFSSKSFKESTSLIFADDVQNVTERQVWMDFPFYVKYQDDIGKIRPFGYSGIAINLLTSSKTEEVYTNKSPLGTETGDKTSEGPDFNLNYKRNFLNYSLVVGGGVKI
ncbi:MAG: PorT family protein [Flammeovirgaceae bacterium]|nr:PorT family protein [Flammeovirgaceae bacterium]